MLAVFAKLLYVAFPRINKTSPSFRNKIVIIATLFFLAAPVQPGLRNNQRKRGCEVDNRASSSAPVPTVGDSEKFSKKF